MQKLVNLASLKPPYKPLASKQVFKVKKRKNGKVLRYKARQVVKGYLQQYGVNYNQTFTAVVKPIAFRALFAIAAYYNLNVTDLITAAVRLLRRDINGLVKTALGELELVKLQDKRQPSYIMLCYQFRTWEYRNVGTQYTNVLTY